MGKVEIPIKYIFEAKLVDYEIDRINIMVMIQKACPFNSFLQITNNILHNFANILKHICKISDDTNDENQFNQVERTKRCIEICILFDQLLSNSRASSGKMTNDTIKEIELNIYLSISKWKELKLLMRMIKIHGIEDHLLEQIR